MNAWEAGSLDRAATGVNGQTGFAVAPTHQPPRGTTLCDRRIHASHTGSRHHSPRSTSVLPDRLITLMAGPHSLGTGAAALAATNSRLIARIQDKLPPGVRLGDKKAGDLRIGARQGE